jgi:hypothetical protein
MSSSTLLPNLAWRHPGYATDVKERASPWSGLMPLRTHVFLAAPKPQVQVKSPVQLSRISAVIPVGSRDDMRGGLLGKFLPYRNICSFNKRPLRKGKGLWLIKVKLKLRLKYISL